MKSADVHLRWNRSFAFFRLLPLLPLLFFSTNISRVCFCLPEDDQISLVIDISWHRADFLLLTHGYNDVVAAASLSLLFFRIRSKKKNLNEHRQPDSSKPADSAVSLFLPGRSESGIRICMSDGCGADGENGNSIHFQLASIRLIYYLSRNRFIG